MIIQNGHIAIKRKAGGGGIDPETGHPIKATAYTYDAPIPCQYIPNKQNNLGRIVGEHFVVASYEILIEAQPIDGERLRLTDDAGQVVGEYSIISIEPLDAVCEMRILIAQAT